MNSRRLVLEHLDATPVVRAEDLPASRRTLRRMVCEGILSEPLPGVLCRGEHDWRHVAAAVPLHDPDAVITGMAAAALTFAPEFRPDAVDVLSATHRRSTGEIRWSRGRIAHEHVHDRNGIRLTDPAFTSVWLAAHDDGAALDAALRAGVGVHDLEAALEALGHRRGTLARRELVRWSQHRPWSAFERRVHRILVDAGITGWVGNHAVRVGSQRVVLDIAFPAQRVALELDGWQFHRSHEAWLRDMRKTNDLQLDGWLVLHFAWGDLERAEWLVAQVQAALGCRDRLSIG